MMYKKILGICSVALLVSSVVLAGCHDHHVVKPKDNPLLNANQELNLYHSPPINKCQAQSSKNVCK